MENPFEAIDKRLEKIECLLLELSNKQELSNKEFNDNELMTIKEISSYLDLSVPRSP